MRDPDENIQNIAPSGQISTRTRLNAWNTVEKLRDADANRFYTSERPVVDPMFYGSRRSRRKNRSKKDPMQVEWLSTRGGQGVQADRDPLKEMPNEGAGPGQLGWTYDGDRWMLTAFDDNGDPKPSTPLAPPRVPSPQHLPSRRSKSCAGGSRTHPKGLPTNRGYSAATNLFQLERVYMDETVKPHSDGTNGLFNRRVTPRRDMLARHPKIDSLHKWGTIQQHNNWVTSAGPPAAWASCGRSYMHEGRK